MIDHGTLSNVLYLAYWKDSSDFYRMKHSTTQVCVVWYAMDYPEALEHLFNFL